MGKLYLKIEPALEEAHGPSGCRSDQSVKKRCALFSAGNTNLKNLVTAHFFFFQFSPASIKNLYMLQL